MTWNPRQTVPLHPENYTREAAMDFPFIPNPSGPERRPEPEEKDA